MGIDSKQVYPKVLIVNGEPINSLTATGITLKNLFYNWPTESLAQIYLWSMSYDNVCAFTHRVTLMDLRLPLKLREIIFAHTNEFKAQNSIQEQVIITEGHKKKKIKLLKTLRGDIYTALNLALLKLPVNLYKSCKEFNPDIIYSMLGSIDTMKLALHLSNHLKVPIVPHFMDDWPTTLSRNFPFAPIFLPIQTYLLHSILRKSPVLLTISDAMAEEYKRRYNKTVYAFMNCVDLSVVPTEVPRSENSCIRFGYIGGLHLNRWQLLNDIGDALQKISNEGLKVELVVYAPSSDIATYGHILSRNSVIKVRGTLASDEVISFLQQCDVLVHVESFDKTDRLYTRFSISTKIPQYMSSGRPILAYGPSEIASCRYIEENGCGVVVGSRQLDLLSQELKNLAVDRSVRKCLGSKGRDVAMRKHDAIKEQERFRKLLKAVADNGN